MLHGEEVSETNCSIGGRITNLLPSSDYFQPFVVS